MGATIVYLVISLLVSLVFIILGISLYRAEKPPREDELTSVAEWNHRHGRNFIILGCVLFITLSVLGYFIEKLDSILLQVIIAMLALFIEIGWVEFEHNVMKKKLLKKEN